MDFQTPKGLFGKDKISQNSIRLRNPMDKNLISSIKYYLEVANPMKKKGPPKVSFFFSYDYQACTATPPTLRSLSGALLCHISPKKRIK